MGKFFLFVSVLIFVDSALAQQSTTKIKASDLTVEQKRSQQDETSEILVQARRRSEKKEDVPVVAHVFTPSRLQENSTRDIVDVFALTPSANFANVTDNHTTANFSIRGVSSAVIGSGVEQPTAFYYDDVYIGTSAAINVDLHDVKQITLMKGPQGTHFGKNAFAGAVNLTTAAPVNKNETTIELTGGNLSLYKMAATTNAPLIKDKLFARVSVSAMDRDGYVTNTFGGDDLKSQNNLGVRAKLRYLPSSKTDVTFSMDYTRDRPVGTAYDEFDAVLNDVVSIKDPYEASRDIMGGSLKMVSQLEPFTVTSISAVRGVGFGAEGSDFLGTNNFNQGQFVQQTQVSQEVRLSSQKSSRIGWSAGVFAYYDDFDEDGYGEAQDIKAAERGNVEESRSTTFTQSYAIFGDLTYPLSRKWDVSTGLRYTHDLKKLNYQFFGNTSSPVFATHQTFSGEQSFNNLSPKVSATYKMLPNIRLYSSVARGYKSGGFNNFVVSGPGFEFKEETAWNYEIGLKSELLNNRLKTNVSAFYFDWKNMQVESYNESLGRTTANASDASSYGVDVEVEGRVTSRWSVSGGYSFSRARFGDFVDFPTPSTSDTSATTDVSGNAVPYASEHSFAIGTRYRQPLSAKYSLISSLTQNYKGSFFFDTLNTLEQDGYGLLNATLTLKARDWSVGVWGKNITDVRYRNSAVNRGALGRVASTGDPATFGVQFRQVF